VRCNTILCVQEHRRAAMHTMVPQHRIYTTFTHCYCRLPINRPIVSNRLTMVGDSGDQLACSRTPDSTWQVASQAARCHHHDNRLNSYFCTAETHYARVTLRGGKPREHPWARLQDTQHYTERQTEGEERKTQHMLPVLHRIAWESGSVGGLNRRPNTTLPDT